MKTGREIFRPSERKLKRTPIYKNTGVGCFAAVLAEGETGEISTGGAPQASTQFYSTILSGIGALW